MKQLYILAGILLLLTLSGCATNQNYRIAEPDSVAPDGKVYPYIYWPSAPSFWE